MATFQNRDERLNQRDQSLDNRDACLNNGARRERVPTGPLMVQLRGGVLMLALLCAAVFGVSATAQSDFYDIADTEWTCNGWGFPTHASPVIGDGTIYYQIGDWKFEIFQVNAADDMDIGITNLVTMNTWVDFIDTSGGFVTSTYTDATTQETLQLSFGTSGGETIYLHDSTNVAILFGMGGADTIVDAGTGGAAYRVAVFGGDGNDTIDMDNVYGNCFLYGDWIELTGTTTWSGIDFIFGSDYSDWIVGGPSGDYLYGMGGSDRIYGDDSLDTGSTAVEANDYIEGGENAATTWAWGDMIYGGGGNDTIYGDVLGSAVTTFTDGDYIEGNAGIDTIYGQEGGDKILGGTGNDAIYGGDGPDILEGGDGDDKIEGGSGGDQINGGDGKDDLFGDDLTGVVAPGDDVIVGGAGDDFIRGGGGDDVIYGDDGDDAIDGGEGEDYLHGGAGTNFLHDDDATDGDTLISGDGDSTTATITDNLIFCIDTFVDSITRTAGSANRIWRDNTTPTDTVGGTGTTSSDSDDPMTLPNSTFYTAPTGGMDSFASYALNVFWQITWADTRS